MKTPITLLFLLFFCGAFAQNFKSKKDVLYVSTTLPAIREAYIIDAASLPTIANSNVAVVVSAASTLPAINYTFSSQVQDNNNSNDYNFYIDVNIPTSNLKQDYDEDIKFNLVIRDKNSNAIVYQSNDFYKVRITNKKALSDYRYLAYVGTNFDLVDGIQAKNLFFATNIYLKPTKNIGFNLSLYGNRAITRIDSILDQERPSRVFDSLGNIYQENRKMDIVRNFQTDNLGANFSVLSKVFEIDDETQFYYNAQLEFIYRRIRMEVKYSNFRTLSPILLDPGTEIITYEAPSRELSQFNIYDFNIGILGFMISHENQNMSIRLFMNTGYSETYLPESASNGLANIGLDGNLPVHAKYIKQGNMFYSGKLWITERTSGITLQGEINNTLNRSNPFYGITLSKAFDFEKIGSIFSPISSR